MKRHLSWLVPVVALALIVAGCSSSDAGSGTDTPTSSTATAVAAAPNPLAEKAATEYKAYAVAQIAGGTHAHLAGIVAEHVGYLLELPDRPVRHGRAEPTR